MVEIDQRHENQPLRPADAERLGPEIAQLFQMHVDRSDHPGESPDNVLIFGNGIAQTDPPRDTRRSASSSVAFAPSQPSWSVSFSKQAKRPLINLGKSGDGAAFEADFAGIRPLQKRYIVPSIGCLTE